MARRVIAAGRSCLECRRRKIKCDRSLPCAYCTHTKLQCAYPSRRPNVIPDEGNLVTRVQSVESTLKSLEQKVAHIGSMLHVSQITSNRQGHSEQDQQLPINAHDLPSPGLSFARNSSQSNQSEDCISIQVTKSRLLQSLPLNDLIDASPLLESLYPPPASILFLWQTYLDVVDPLFKIFHVPSTQRYVMSMSQGRKTPDAATECLVFAIYYSAVTSIPAAECRQGLDEEKPVLLQRFRRGVERSLVRANFWCSPNITVLQAFIIYLTCGRQDEHGPDVCSLIGVAIGNAMKLGLHIDIPGMRVFDLEMRRRLWWQICTLDVRIAEDFGTEPMIFELSFSTKLPLNINDMSLDLDMEELPIPQPGRSEMLFSLVRFEVSNFARRIVFSDSFCLSNGYQILSESQKCQALDQFRERIEKQYLSYCYKGVPLDCITVKSCRLILAKLKLAVCKPRINQNHRNPLRADYRKACEEVLEHAHILRQYSEGRRWLWLFQTYLEWDALAYLLLDICITAPLPSAREPITVPWKVIDESYNHWKNNPDVYQDRRWSNIEELRSQALLVLEKAHTTMQTQQTDSSCSSRSANNQSDGMSDTISKIQQQHEKSSDVMNSQHTTTMAENELSHLCFKLTNNNAQIQQPGITGLQNSESDISVNQVPQMWALADVPSAEEIQAPANSADLPGAETVCEWSSALIERYWEIAGQGYDDSNAWHSA